MADLVFTIKTPAELDGAKQAEATLEKLRGRAGVLGKDLTQIDAKLKQVRESIASYESSGAGVETIGKMASTAAVSTKELGDSAKALADHTKDSLNPALAAHQELLEEGITVADKSFASTKQVKDAFRELGHTIPGASTAARIAMNPVATAAASVAAAILIWRNRVRELQATYASAELPDLSQAHVARVSAAAEAWKNFGEAYKQAVEATKTPGSIAQRAIQDIEDQVTAQKKLLEAYKANELARLELGKENLTPEEYATQRVEIEKRYGQAGLNVDARAADMKIQASKQEQSLLRDEARRKSTEAGSIRVAPAAVDARNMEDMKAAAEVAQAEIARRRQRLSDLGDLEAGTSIKDIFTGDFWATRWKQFRSVYRYGDAKFSGEGLGQRVAAGDKDAIAEARQIERQALENAQVVVDRYNYYLDQAEPREDKRQKRKELMTEAGTAAGQADVIDERITRDTAKEQQRRSVDSEVERVNQSTEQIKLQKQVEEENERLRKQDRQEAERLGRDADRSINRGQRGDLSALEGPLQDFTDGALEANERLLAILSTANTALASLNERIDDMGGKIQDSINT